MNFMGFREYINKIDKEGLLRKVDLEVSKKLEISGILKEIEPTPVLFNKVKESEFRVVGNVFCTKDVISSYFGVTPADLIPMLSKAIDERSEPEIVTNAPCQEVVETEVDLDKIPILFHCDKDGGNYISSAVVVTRDPDYGQNLDFHRAMQYSKDKFATRIVKGRHFYKFLEKNGEVEVAFCIGNTPNILIAGATSVDIGVDELEIANALEPIKVVKAHSVDLLIPAEAEFVLEGKVYFEERHAEGPFVDLTETLDIIREEPVFEVKKITHRKEAIWQALLPGALEHKILMGMPREPTIFNKINATGVKCLDVNISPGGSSWLHAIVQIDKKTEEDGKKAIEGTFEGHTSCKHVFIVDKDINIYDPLSVEWAMATRFQGDTRMVVKDKEPGSSLDPSAEPGTKMTTKIGFDLTKPLVIKGKSFEIVEFPKVDVNKYF
ncbi:MAG: UbiD family decarboxylase [Candidatus Heimdallarchaeota archaeon]|nr:MAG: UbiD family decarboxylase [Candidatus Heimdallarchaeota archaeon]